MIEKKSSIPNSSFLNQLNEKTQTKTRQVNQVKKSNNMGEINIYCYYW